MKKIWLLFSLFINAQVFSADSAVEQLRHIPVPVFGHYYSQGYHLMGGETGVPKHCRISKKQAEALTPHGVTAASGVSDFFLSMVGTRGRKVNNHDRANLDTLAQVPPPWNVLFHGWSGIADNTADNVSMGVFDYQGIQPIDLGNNKLTPLQVHPHGVYCSPNNAKFNPNPVTTQFMTFGLVGSYKGRSIVVYQIVINNDKAQEMLDALDHTVHGGIESPYILLNLLENSVFQEHFTQANDIARLQETIGKLKTILGATAGPARPPRVHHSRNRAVPTQLSEEEQLALALALSEEDAAERTATKVELLPREEAASAPAPLSEEEQLALALALSEEDAATSITSTTDVEDPEIMTEEEMLEFALAASLAEVQFKNSTPPIAPQRRPAPVPPQQALGNIVSELEQILARRRRE